MTDPSATIPPISGSSETNADLPTPQFPRLQRITSTDLVGILAANRQHASLEKRTDTLLSSLNQIIDIANALDTWFLRRDGSTQKDSVGGVTGDIPMNERTLLNLRAAAANGQPVRYEEFVALAALVGGVSSTPPGMIAGFGGSIAPAGWLVADGTLYTTSGYYKDDGILLTYPPSSPGSLSWATLTNLRTHLGMTWGGDGTTSFRIPDYRGRAIIGAGIGKNGQVTRINVVSGGSGFSSTPSITIAPPAGGGVNATATAIITGGVLVRIDIVNPGTNYTSTPSVTISDGGGTGAAATATITLTNRLLGTSGGEESHVQTAAEAARHAHTVVAVYDGSGGTSNIGDQGSASAFNTSLTTTYAGSSDPSNIMQPWATATVCIKY